MDTIIDLARNLGGVIAGVFYLATVLWTWKDARRRIADPILVATAVLASIVLPIFGVFVYMLLRPPEYLADVRERELEIRAIERALGRQERCPTCSSFIESDYLSCPICLTKLRDECVGCDRPIDPRWQMCPYCETEVRSRRASSGKPPARGARRRRTSRPADTGKKSDGESKRRQAAPDDTQILTAQTLDVQLEPLSGPTPQR